MAADSPLGLEVRLVGPEVEERKEQKRSPRIELLQHHLRLFLPLGKQGRRHFEERLKTRATSQEV